MASGRGWRCALDHACNGHHGSFRPLVALACLDVLGVAAVWLVSYGLIGAWFPGTDEQARLASAVLVGVFYWRLYMLAFRIFLRPGLAAARQACRWRRL